MLIFWNFIDIILSKIIVRTDRTRLICTGQANKSWTTLIICLCNANADVITGAKRRCSRQWFRLI